MIRRRAGSEGQATVEFALLLPVAALLLLAFVQLGVVVHDRVMVTHAAREGVRVAAVGGTDDEVRRAVEQSSGLTPARLEVRVERAGRVVTVSVTYVVATEIPLVGVLVDDAVMSAQARMQTEAPP